MFAPGAPEADQKCGGKHTAAGHICIAKNDSYGQLIKSVGAFAPTAPPIPAPMVCTLVAGHFSNLYNYVYS